MSGRGRGSGGARGGGRGGRNQPSPSAGRGRGRGDRGGGGGGGISGRGSQSYNAPSPSDFPSLSPASVRPSVATPASARPVSSAPSVSAPSQEFQQKLSIQTSDTTSARTPTLPSSSSGVQTVQPAVQKQSTPVSSKAFRAPHRPGFGTVGTKCGVRANHFLVHVADRDIHHYDVSITPEVTSKKICRKIMNQLVSSYQESHLGKRMLAYDGRKSAYAAGSLPFSSKEFVINLSDIDDGARRERQFKVSIKFAAKIDLYQLLQFLQRKQLDSPQETIQALDVVLRENPSLQYEVVGRSFFSPSLGAQGELGGGLEYWKGFYQSLRPTQMGLSLNIDVSARAFYEPIPVTEFITKYLNIRNLTRPLSDKDCVMVKKALRGIRVETNHLGHIKRYKVTGISREPVRQLTFPLSGTGTHISVAEYFRRDHNIVLNYPFLPAILFGKDAKYLPMEICRIVEGQRYTKKLNDRQVSAMLNATCQRPAERENNIKKILGQNNYNADKLVQEFGIQVSPALTSIEARVLPSPMLKYHETGQESRVSPRVGQWNMINKKMVNAGRVEYWTGISFSRSGIDTANKFCEALVDMCCSKGMEFNRPSVPIQMAHASQIERALADVHNKSGGKLQLLIVILPDATGSYGTIKRVCETELGIVSQCCKPDKASKRDKQYLENVALKINVKVGGRNSVLEHAIQRRIPFLTDLPTIVFGADVTHPRAGEDAGPSIAAVVASMDWPEVTKYRGQVSSQCSRQEIIEDLYKKSTDPHKGIVHGGMIRELLLAFYRSTNQKPHRIIFYRDGVSEGQFSQVLLDEMDAIRQACVSLQENYLPPVTFVVVQKRHHTRVFPANHGDRYSTDRSGNILPGTVIDTQICHPLEFDFYLCSHAGIKGTSRPTHYHVLYDENKFTADALQLLTYNLCYTYARCTRSVSVVPPAYYAHLAAFRARYYIEGEMSDSGSTGTGAGRASRERDAEVRALPTIRDNVKDVMFYC